jgi:phage gpG-like protein
MDNYQESNNEKEEKNEKKQQENDIKPKVCLTKDDLILHIKEWIKIDNEITNLKSQLKEKTTKKKELTESLVNVMKSNSIDCFDINGGSLIYKQRKTKRTISGKFLLSQLEEHYKEQPELAKEITKKVLDNRSKVVKDEIIRKIEK